MASCVLVSGCGKTERTVEAPLPPPPTSWVIPAGPAEWVFVERELPLEAINPAHMILPYGAGSTGRALKREKDSDPKTVVRYQIVSTADVFNADERCALTIIGFQIVYLDGTVTTIPASGSVIDNSDNRSGFRVELSLTNRNQLVIPAHANATVMLAEPITVRTR
jgi:hypothetical protein